MACCTLRVHVVDSVNFITPSFRKPNSGPTFSRRHCNGNIQCFAVLPIGKGSCLHIGRSRLPVIANLLKSFLNSATPFSASAFLVEHPHRKEQAHEIVEGHRSVTFIRRFHFRIPNHLFLMLLLVLLGVGAPALTTAQSAEQTLGLGHQSAEIAAQSVCTSNDIRSFPFPLLTKEEREARFRFFMKDTPLHLVERADNVDVTTCEALLQHMRSFDAVRVLEPTFSSWEPSADMPHTVAPACPNLDLDSEYFGDDIPNPRLWRRASTHIRDPHFLNMPRGQKEALSREYVTATAGFEYYDLSTYLPQGFWGYFAEGGRAYDASYKSGNQVVSINPPKLRLGPNCIPQFSISSTIEKLVNIHTCKTASDPYQPVNRVGSTIYPGGPGGSDYPMPDFFAFIDIAGSLYRVNLSFFSPLTDLERLLVPERRSLNVFVDRIDVVGKDAEVRTVCSFSTQTQLSPGYDIPPGIKH
jgi:hypothetical protein